MSNLDTMDGKVAPLHEAGWLSKGLPFTRWRQHRVHCNTCGKASDYHHDRRIIEIVAQGHTAFPKRDLNRMLADVIEMDVERKKRAFRERK